MGFEIFAESGPRHMRSSVDWNCRDQQRAVLACLVKGTTVQECARHKRKNPDPSWWTSFHFNVVENIKDGSSIFGTIYRFNPPSSNSSSCSAPDYVITFRGTLFKPETFVKEIELDINIIRNDLHKTPKAQLALDAAWKVVSEYGNGRTVWLVGHSLGAALAMHVGKSMVISHQTYLETFLFNPPYVDLPFESMISNENVRTGVRIVGGLFRAGLVTLMKGQREKSEEYFDKLARWVPHLFVNGNDWVCAEYVGYFKNRETMEGHGMGDVGRLATRNSPRVLIRNALGQDAQPLHLLPSAMLVVNSNRYPEDNFGPHRINQWLKPGLNLEYKRYLIPNEDN